MFKKIKELPCNGDLVWCRFPDVDGEETSKPRPAIVIGVSEVKHEVVVVFGTSRKTTYLYPTEFLIAKDDGDEPFIQSGLSYNTKFDFSRTKILPFTTQFFDKAPRKHNIPFPKMGSVHIMYYSAMLKAKQKA